MTQIRRLLRDERGDIADLPAYTILVIGVFIPFLAVIFILGRFANAENTVQAAAAAAARDASLSRDTITAATNAEAAAALVLSNNVNCRSTGIQIDDSGLRTALGQTGLVSATVNCTISYTDLLLPGLPSQTTITKTAISPVDPYRER